MKSQHQKGFTLMELIIVIGIISMLMLMGIGSYSNIQRSARDTRRMSDLKELRTALYSYYADEGSYPDGTSTGSFCTPDCGTSVTDPTNWILLSTEYVNPLPIDPLNRTVGGTSYGYTYFRSGVDAQTFTIVAELESGTQYIVSN